MPISPSSDDDDESHETNAALPSKIEGSKYRIKTSQNREQWNHANILAEPRLNLVFKTYTDEN